ncbi:hypothetical protein [Guptibacillus hwajinpoensis]|uniref:DUF2157 domain-containing protein n=1 Tax=Guptibacillus hwajinpoensis TaxID=208199 RepID=A0ABU0K1U4_9BACL|nr:hypothetical protein [Alkalihalobacillus hemicentroti]MDQ0482650.1 hypothetical protein [Alkalihalobacillus hemicentroti]
MNERARETVFQDELKRLRLHDYIEGETYELVSAAYQEMLDQISVEKTEVESKKTQKQPSEPVKKQRPVKETKVKSPQELRDRNLTWILVIGVVFLLLGALVLATSTWDVMTSAMKTALIGGISAVFFGISWLSGHKLKIEKTAFAFLILGSLFLPIVVLSAGYFQLFGEWLSVTGAGNDVLGLIGALICLPLYAFHALRQNSRLFVWFSFVTLSIGVAFFINLFNPTVDVFYLGIVLFNGLLLLAYAKTKNAQNLAIFTKELPLYAQGNLVLSTLLLLFFFESEVFYSFNVILTAVLYLSMIYIGKQKEYHFVFTALLVYGIYQLIEHSILGSLDVMLYAILGFVFIGLQNAEPFQNPYLKKAFQLTSAVVSFCAFVFISYKGLVLRYDDPSWLLVLGYFVISLNYLYLANISRYRMFGFLSPFFLAAALLYPISLVYENPSNTILLIHQFLTGLFIYVGGFYLNKWRYTIRIQTGSLFVSFGPMGIALLLGAVTEKWWLESVMLFVLGIIYLSIYQKGKWLWIRYAGAVLNPIAWTFALLVLYLLFTNNNGYVGYGFPLHTGITACVIIALHYLWKRKEQKLLEATAFWTGVSVYGISLVMLLVAPVNELFVRTSLLVGAIGILYLMLKRTNELSLWYLMSIFTLGAYLSAAEAFPFQGVFQWILGSILLIIIADTIAKKNEFVQRVFFYLSHLYLPIAIIYTVSEQGNVPILYAIAIGIYLYTILTRIKEWEIRSSLYAGFTMVPLLYISSVSWFELTRDAFTYTGFAASLVMFALWFLLNEKWKERIKWYAVPFSIIGLVPFTIELINMSMMQFTLGVSYAVLLLYVMHKSGWQLFTIAPLLFVVMFILMLPFETVEVVTIVRVLSATIILVAGLLIHRTLYSIQSKSIEDNHIDWYSVVALLTVLTLYPNGSALWLDELPAIMLVVIFILQIKRVPSGLASRIVKSLTATSFLIPYYTLLNHIELNQYIIAEVYVLPWLALTIYLVKRTWAKEERVMVLIEWAVLTIIASILVADALISNTIYDAIIAGGLSLASVIAGFLYRIKSYFIIGCSVLLLNVFVQTRPYWGNMPWWAYLLIAGSTLIAVASFYEWQKQNRDDEGNTLLQLKKQKVIDKWKEWR